MCTLPKVSHALPKTSISIDKTSHTKRTSNKLLNKYRYIAKAAGLLALYSADGRSYGSLGSSATLRNQALYSK